MNMRWKQNDLEDICCDFCGKNSTHHVFLRPDGLNVVECNNCGLSYISPRPKTDLIHRLYDDEYFLKKKVPSHIGYSNYTSDQSHNWRLEVSQNYFKIFSKNIGILPGRCLEIGCATGEFCYTLSQKDISVIGIDIAEFAISQARNKYPDLDFRCCDIEALGVDEKFDAIFAFETIEHVVSPNLFLQKLRQHLNKDGLIVISTPNYECGKMIGVENWRGFHQSFEHLHFFSYDILRRYAESHQLSVLCWFTGCGNGLKDGSKNTSFQVRDFLKKLLKKMRLIDIVRKIRNYHGVLNDNIYRSQGYSHDLLIIFKKK